VQVNLARGGGGILLAFEPVRFDLLRDPAIRASMGIPPETPSGVLGQIAAYEAGPTEPSELSNVNQFVSE
jgi:hypothetical protein